MASKHKWSETVYTAFDAYSRPVDATMCERCLLERTREPGTKTVHLYRKNGETGWSGYRAGFVPPCERQPKPAGGEGA